MLNFTPVTIDDRDKINEFFLQSIYRNCDFSFSNIFSWKHKYNTTFCISEGFLFFRFYTVNGYAGYMMPLGSGDLRVALEILLQEAEERNDKFYMYAITEDMFARVEEALPGKFQHKLDRSWSEYLYKTEDLIMLKGKKLQSKRNHINKFRRLFAYEYIPITKDIIPECLELYYKWCQENGGCNEDESLREEKISTETVFENFNQLGLRGGALRVDGRIIAYSYGQQLGPDTFGVHAEKALYEIEGAFSMINQQFAEHECQKFVYINREEDLGLESLRQAKMSYQPAILLSKGYIKKR